MNVHRDGQPPGRCSEERGCGARHLPLLLLLMLPVAGCGPKYPTAAAGGVVTLDGKPLADAAVLFMPVEGGVPARGSTAADGSFSLSTFDRDDGALIGRHRVSVAKVTYSGFEADADGLSKKLDGRAIREQHLSPERYENPATSGLEAEVKRGSANRFEFGLSSE